MATATLPPLPLAIKAGSIPRQEPIDDGDFWLYQMIPVFKEHERNGVVFDSEAMDEIANESNLRIEDTGDYVPIVLRHNEDDKDSKVVGYAGPFVVGEFGRLNPVACIYAEEFRIQKTDRDEVSRYPRLSVELWAKKDAPNRGYFDPICLLGSETPHLDLGIQRYARKPADAERFRVCYSMDNAMTATASPASTNTFVPGMGNEKREDVDSMDNEPVKYQEGMNGGGLATEDIQQIVAALEETIVTIIGAELDRRGMGGGADAGMGAADPLLSSDPAVNPIAADPTAIGAALSDGPPGADDALPPEMGDSEPSGDETPGDSDPTTETAAEDTPGDDEDDKDGDGKPAKYRKAADDADERERVDYRRAHDDLQTKYAKLEAELAIARGEKVKAVRYQRLTALAGEGFMVNADEEIADCEGMSDDQFTKHETRIRTKYAKSRTTLPGTQPETKKPVVPVTDKDERSRLAAIARDNCLKYQKDGKPADYKAELRKVYEQNGKSWDEK